MREIIITEERFNQLCNNIISDISPLRKWNKGEIEGMIKYEINHWIYHTYRICNKINQYELIVVKTGRTLETTLKYDYGWENRTETIKSISKMVTKDEAYFRLGDCIVKGFVSNEIIKNKGNENPMLNLLLNKITASGI